jgi:hypothetical protein
VREEELIANELINITENISDENEADEEIVRVVRGSRESYKIEELQCSGEGSSIPRELRCSASMHVSKPNAVRRYAYMHVPESSGRNKRHLNV